MSVYEGDSLRLERDFQLVNSLKQDVENRSAISKEAFMRAEKELDKVLELKRKIKDLQKQQQNDVQVQDGADNQDIKSNLENYQAQLQKQIEIEQRERKLALYARKELDDADLILSRHPDLAREVSEAVKKNQRKLQKESERRLHNENMSVKRKEELRIQKMETLAESIKEIESKALRQIEQGNIGKEKGRERIIQGMSKSTEVQKILDAIEKSKYEKKAKSFMKLKNSIERASKEVCDKNEANTRKEKQRKEEEDKEKNSILAAGENPYEVFRRRRLDAEKEKTYLKLVKKEKDEEMRIAERMIAEDQYLAKREIIEEKNREYKKKYQGEMGRGTTEARVTNYMKANVIGGSEYVSLTGTQKFDPSQVTVIKDHSFGFGDLAKSRPDIVEKVRAKKTNAGVQFHPLFVPKLKNKALEINLSNNKGESIDELMILTPSAPPGTSATFFLSGSESVKSNNHDDDIGGMAVEDRANITSPSKRFAPPKMSVLEQRMMKEARVRQRENIVEKQVVWGKEFKGKAFLSQPEQVVFEDFTVDVPVTQQFVLTNVSNTFNNFSLLKLPNDVIDFFDISFTKPGRMSAGMTCTLTITFLPKVNKDIMSEIPFLAKTGPFSIPLICTTKKAIPKVKLTDIDIGNVVMGESNTVYIEVVNEGALDVEYDIINDESAALSSTRTEATDENNNNNEELKESDKPIESDVPILSYNQTGKFNLFSTSFLEFKFTPKTVGNFRGSFILRYKDPSCADVKLNVRARGVKVPIFVDNPLIDFRCCVSDKLYRSKLIVRNRGNVALKCTLKTPPCFGSTLEFIPTLGFVQGFNANTKKVGLFEFQMKFRPTMDLLKSCEKYVNTQDNSISVPIQLFVPEQTLPVFFTLKAQLTTSDIIFDPPNIDFGSLYACQGVNFPLKITNTSSLPQKFGFIHLPSYISVLENDGFGTLLPNETIVRNIVFCPPTVSNFSFSLKMQTSLNRNFIISCKGEGLLSPLTFSVSKIKFPPVSLGDRNEHSVIVSNNSKTIQSFQFVVPYPKVSQIKISPLVESLEPGKTCRVVFEFIPTAETPESISQCASILPQEGIVDYSSENRKLGDNENTEEPWSRHGRWKIPCYIKGDNNVVSSKLLYMEINTTTIHSDVVSDTTKINFGQVPMGKDSTIQVRIRNNGNSKITLSKNSLNSLGSFSVVNSCRPVEPKQSFILLVQFKPINQRIFSETLILHHEKGNIPIDLIGEGVSPSYTIDPKNGKIDFGHVLLGSEVSNKVKIKNCSVFPLKYSIEAPGLKHSNFSLREVFSCTPSEAVLAAGQEQDITVTFFPDHERPVDYYTEFQINVANQKETQKFVARGHCWSRQTFATACTPEDSLMMQEADKIEDFYEIPGSLNQALPQIPLRLDFGKDCKPDTERSIYVGSAVADKGGSAGTFEIKLPDNSFFTVDIPKGNTTVGKPVKVTFKQKPIPVTGNEGDLKIGQSVKNVAQCILRGGFVPVGAPAEQIIDILLTAFNKG